LAISQSDPLELIASWLVSRYSFEVLSRQVGISPAALEEWIGKLFPTADPAPAAIPAASSEADNNWVRIELLKALQAERNAPSARLDWTGESGTANITLPVIGGMNGAKRR
jgi:hypothetical protein